MSIFDDTTFENHQFKPINKGLGFSTPKVQKKLRTSSFAIKTSPKTTTRSQNLKLEQTPKAIELNDDFSIEALNQIYDKNTKARTHKPFNSKGKLIEAGILEQAMAFALDLAFCFACFYLLNFGFMKALKLSSSFESIVAFVIEFPLFEISLFSLFFLFYFTLFEPMGTFGKTLFSLETRTFSGKSLTLFESFKRSFSSLFCMVLAFGPLLLDWQGRMSQTRVYRKA